MIPNLAMLDALLAGITKADLEMMPPAHRQRLAQALRQIADLADPPRKADPPGDGEQAG
jgi:hypothetical protein